MAFCDNCGHVLKPTAKFCGKCGTHVVEDYSDTQTEYTNSQTEYTDSQSDIQYAKPSVAWWLLTIFLPVLGGGIAWLALRKRDCRMARRCLIVGFVLSIGVGFVSAMLEGSNSSVLQVESSQSIGTLTVAIDKIEFSNNNAKIFLTVQNTGGNEAHFYERQSYVKQGNMQFQYKYCSGVIDGYNIPSGIIREGVICVEAWDTSEPSQLSLYGMYWKGGTFGDWIDSYFTFSFEPYEG